MREVAAFCRQWNMIRPGQLVLCAVSGGRDSMALLHKLAALAEQEGFRVAAAHYNHRLRPTADRDEETVRRWCEEQKIPCLVGGGDVKAAAEETGENLEAVARRMRYAFLEEAADELGADRIATAHHRQDNAETLLLHLLRGTGLQGLTGIAPVRGRIIRPMLTTDREEIDRYILRHRIPYQEDETNGDTAYFRNRLRLQALPLLEDLAPGSIRRMGETALLLQDENAALEAAARRLLPERTGDRFCLSHNLLAGESPALRRRLVRAAAAELGLILTREQTEKVLALASGSYLDLGEGVWAAKKPHELILGRACGREAPVALRHGEQRWENWLVTVEEMDAPAGETEGICLTCPAEELTLAVWDGSGRLNVGNGSRTVKRLFADRGIPVEKRGEHPALYRGERVAAVFGVAADEALTPRPGERCVCITLKPVKETDS